jgi:hypothetical protein
MPKLTIGMAHYNDVQGLIFTIQSLRMHHAVRSPEVEIVVVDNSANLPITGHLHNFLGTAQSWGDITINYVPMTEPVGTSPTRNKIFEVATGDFVLVMDCHVMLDGIKFQTQADMHSVGYGMNGWGALDRLLEFYTNNPKTDDLYSGPLLTDDLHTSWTHFNDEWRGAEGEPPMWGTWSTAWQCPCGGSRFSLLQVGDQFKPIALTMGPVGIESCYYCNNPIPQKGPWYGHQRYLEQQGWVALGRKPDEEPFEIPGQGLGLFTCRRESWLKFNDHSRGFGGEELYIHEKYRQAGRKVWCLPFLRWWHRFFKEEGHANPYPNTTYGRCRNYLLEFQELGRDVTVVRDQHVGKRGFTEEMWNRLIADPVKNIQETAPVPPCATCPGGSAEDPEFTSLEAVYEKVRKIPRDMEQHMPKLRELAATVSEGNNGHITEISHRREGTIAFLAAKPKFLRSYNNESVSIQVSNLAKAEGVPLEISAAADGYETIEPTDMLFIDDVGSYLRVGQHLERHASKVRRYIAFHDTVIYDKQGEDGGVGMTLAIREYLITHREWSVCYHTNEEHGLTVISRDPRDKHELPPLTEELRNVTRSIFKAAVGYVKGEQIQVEPEQLEERLAVCAMCTHRVEDRCGVCGCYIDKKAHLATEQCPLVLWPLIPLAEKPE